jgi:hypothetical protein
MVHPVPDLTISPIYPIAWLLIGLWVCGVAVVALALAARAQRSVVRGQRRTRQAQNEPPDAIWILMRRAPLLLEDGAPRSTRSIFRRVVERIRHLIRR